MKKNDEIDQNQYGLKHTYDFEDQKTLIKYFHKFVK